MSSSTHSTISNNKDTQTMDYTDSLYDQPAITIYFYGDGVTFPSYSSVEVSEEDTIAGLKDHIFNKAEEEGFDVKNIEQESMIVAFQDGFRDNGEIQLCHYSSNNIQLKAFRCSCKEDCTCSPKVAFLPCFL